MISFSEMYQAQHRYQDLMDETKAPRYNEVLDTRPGATKRLMKHLKAALSKPAQPHRPAIRKPAGAH